jgi:hypothetical protein
MTGELPNTCISPFVGGSVPNWQRGVAPKSLMFCPNMVKGVDANFDPTPGEMSVKVGNKK